MMRSVGRSVMIVGMLLMTTACGRKGALIYPDMLVPAAPFAVTAQQSGSSVKLQFTLPDKDRAGRPLQSLAGVKISRRAAETKQKDICRSCMDDYRLFRTLYLDHLPATSQRFGSRLVVLDNDVSSGNSYSYSIVPFTSDNLDGASSPTVHVQMAHPLPAPVLNIESFPTEVRLQLYIQPLIVGHQLGYNRYRSYGESTRSYQPLNREPLQGNEYVDVALERGVKYRYSARALILLASGDIAESAESDGVEGMLKDDE